jgi:hypothetical protein
MWHVTLFQGAEIGVPRTRLFIASQIRGKHFTLKLILNGNKPESIIGQRRRLYFRNVISQEYQETCIYTFCTSKLQKLIS